MRTLIAAALLMLTAVSSAGAQAPDITLDFVSQAIAGSPVKAGRTMRIKVKNLNALCFTPVISVTLHEASYDASAAQTLFKTPTKPAPTPPPGSPSITTPSTPETSVTAAGDSTTPYAVLLVKGAAQILKSVKDIRNRAHLFVSSLDDMDCESSWNISTLLNQWQAEREELIDDVSAMLDTIDDARVLLTAAEATLDGKKDGLAIRIAELRQDADDATDEATSFRAAQTKLDAAAAQSSLDHVIDTDGNHRAATIRVASGRSDGKGEVVRTFEIPLRRQHRIAFTTGIISTKAPSTHYDRVNRSRAADSAGAPDVEYSTFARTSGGGSWDLINPALLVSASIVDVAGAAFYLSGGTTLRSVNNAVSLEPLVGGAVGLLDRLFLQAGLHFGREEELLITREGEDAKAVSARAVPSTVTRSDAVGTLWDWHYYVGFSLKVN